MLECIQNLRQTRKDLFEKYQKGIITSEELHLLDEIDNKAKGIVNDIKKTERG